MSSPDRPNGPTTEGHHEAIGHQRRASQSPYSLVTPPGRWDFSLVDDKIEVIICRLCKAQVVNYQDAIIHECS